MFTVLRGLTYYVSWVLGRTSLQIRQTHVSFCLIFKFIIMKKFLCFAILLVFILDSCSKDDEVMEPTYENIPGVWKLTDYQKNGTSIFNNDDYSNNYFMFNTDQTFSARLGAANDDDEDVYFFGDMSLSDRYIGVFPSGIVDVDDVTLYVDNISDGELILSNSGEGYTYTFSKVNNSTTYQVANESSYSMSFVSFNYDNGITDFCVHGTIDSGETGEDIVYSEKSDIMLGMYYYSTYILAVYPQKLEEGENNAIALYDTTTVYASTSSFSVQNMMKEKSASKPMKLIDAIKN